MNHESLLKKKNVYIHRNELAKIVIFHQITKVYGLTTKFQHIVLFFVKKDQYSFHQYQKIMLGSLLKAPGTSHHSYSRWLMVSLDFKSSAKWEKIKSFTTKNNC